ncbi:RND superfamily putative drug exporter [Nocardia neocaledoniensis]|uniref:RND superfamily putative drug exporter n=3 Tax=Nocardia neocaledoniensis TaxID=236511 RepID=A0A317NKS8_9NOCA|nr:MMPL family transporter [Nocardia neocaledoniensis]PWV74198.1 RND superfamily putative drug exporter [Nocardia neocaledoniensis]
MRADEEQSWDRFARLVTGRRSWVLLLAVVAAAVAVMGLAGSNDSAGQAPVSLPSSSESARAAAALAQFPGAGEAAAIAVATRTDDGALTPADLAALDAALVRAGVAANSLVPAPDGRAALAPVPVSADLNGFALTDRIDELRAAVTTDLPEPLRVQVTGGPAFGADIADSFSGANTLLLIVTALVVMVLLILTYRSPVLWLVPLTVVGLADRVATSVGTALAQLTGLTFDGSTSGITSVLVFGAGTNYALLLVSRYRDELHRHTDHREALRAAVRHAAPAIVASNVTVVLALLTLLLAALPNTRSLGAFAAAGLVVALIFVLCALPPALALCGRRVFWPFVPAADGRDPAEHGTWAAVATRVVRRPALVAGAAGAVLVVFATGLLTTDIGLSRTEQFRVEAESVDGLRTMAAHFPSGAADPAVVVARTATDAAVQSALEGVDGVSRATRTGTDADLSRWSVVLDAAPGSAEAFTTVEGMRTAVGAVPGADALVGGSDAEALDIRDAARRDQALVIPLILAVVLLVLLVLLRAVPASLLLVGVTVLSALAALGAGSWISDTVFGFPALDTNVPLFGFLFLVALGVDYTIFLVTRAREEAATHGTTRGMVRAVASTGAVITSAGAVLAAVFCVLGVLPLITLTQLGIVVGVGILLDTFVVRTLVVPALFELLGDKVWWPAKPQRAEPKAPAST